MGGGSGEQGVGNGSSSDDGLEQQKEKPKRAPFIIRPAQKRNSFNNNNIKPDNHWRRRKSCKRSIWRAFPAFRRPTPCSPLSASLAPSDIPPLSRGLGPIASARIRCCGL